MPKIDSSFLGSLSPVIPLTDITGHRSHRLTAMDCLGIRGRNVYWRCVCDCGNETAVSSFSLVPNGTKSCGCARLGNDNAYRSHGMTKTKTYKAWQGMWQRCTNSRDVNYRHYGARGIVVDPSWKSFERFHADMGEPPTKQHSIERKDNNGDYSKNNCRWATMKEQGANRRTSRYLTAFGKTLIINEWVRISGHSFNTIVHRVSRGMSPEDAISLPDQRHKTNRQSRMSISESVSTD